MSKKGSMSRGARKRDKTSVHNINFPFLSLRANRKRTRSAIAKYLRNLRSYTSSFSEEMYDKWVIELRKLCELPYFLGYMTLEEIEAQAQEMNDNTYFVCFSEKEPTGLFICRTYMAYNLQYTYDGVLQFDAYGTMLHRSDALIYQKKLKKRARNAIDTWSIIARRARIVKDIRIMIGKIIWKYKGSWIDG